MLPFGYVILIFAAAICCPTQSKSAEQAAGSSSINDGEELPKISPANPKMHEIFLADQAIRLEVEKRGGWKGVKDDKIFMQRWKREDLERLRRTKELLESNKLQAGIDFYHAAFVFQHSSEPEDYLKAHHLAVIAISKGYDARWISAATLDRYLLSVGKQQIYGTQYRANEVGEYVREPVEPGIVNDSERAQLNVPLLIEEK
jgi:hypothetical protein